MLALGKEHVETLGTEMGCGWITSDVSNVETRLGILHTQDCVVATSELAREGLNKKSLDTLMILTPFRDSNMLQQAIGRILREFAGKKNPLVIIFEDDDPKSRSMCKALQKYLRASGIKFKLKGGQHERRIVAATPGIAQQRDRVRRPSYRR